MKERGSRDMEGQGGENRAQTHRSSRFHKRCRQVEFARIPLSAVATFFLPA
jgi:hypothetical protein